MWRNGGAEERQNIQTGPSRCFPSSTTLHTTQNIRGYSTQFGTFGPVHALITEQNCHVNLLRTLIPFNSHRDLQSEL